MRFSIGSGCHQIARSTNGPDPWSSVFSLILLSRQSQLLS